MVDVKIEHNAGDLELGLNFLKAESLRKARKTAIFKAGAHIDDKVTQWMKTDGQGSWPDVHPLTKIWQTGSKNSQGRIKKRAGRYEGAYANLRKNFDYGVNEDGTELTTQFFGTDSGGRTTHKTENFDRMQTKQTIQVTKEMRLRMASTRANKGDVAGTNGFFPLRKNRKTLKIAARPVIKPVFRRIKTSTFNLYENIFNDVVETDFKKIGK